MQKLRDLLGLNVVESGAPSGGLPAPSHGLMFTAEDGAELCVHNPAQLPGGEWIQPTIEADFWIGIPGYKGEQVWFEPDSPEQMLEIAEAMKAAAQQWKELIDRGRYPR